LFTPRRARGFKRCSILFVLFLQRKQELERMLSWRNCEYPSHDKAKPLFFPKRRQVGRL
jgi:hypothetical protein